jgi:type IV pilus assembly protein PilE
VKANKASSTGFSLIELMIVVTVVSILAAVAVPSYRQYNIKANRSQAAQLLLTISNREEQYLLDARLYIDILGSSGLNIKQDNWSCGGATSTTCTNAFYTVTVTPTSGPPPSWSATAVPIAGSYQAADGTLTLSSDGTRTRSAGDLKW